MFGFWIKGIYFFCFGFFILYFLIISLFELMGIFWVGLCILVWNLFLFFFVVFEYMWFFELLFFCLLLICVIWIFVLMFIEENWGILVVLEKLNGIDRLVVILIVLVEILVFNFVLIFFVFWIMEIDEIVVVIVLILFEILIVWDVFCMLLFKGWFFGIVLVNWNVLLILMIIVLRFNNVMGEDVFVIIGFIVFFDVFFLEIYMLRFDVRVLYIVIFIFFCVLLVE